MGSALSTFALVACLAGCGATAQPVPTLPANTATVAPTEATNPATATIAAAKTAQVATSVARARPASPVSPSTPVAGMVGRIPDLTGPYRVGSVIRTLVDPSRPDPYAADPAYHREVLIQIWYPGNPAPGATPDRYWPDLDQLGYAEAGVSIADFAQLRGHAFSDAPFVDTPVPFPVVTFSHGDSGNRIMYSALAQELVSHGYVVVGIDHPYTNAGTRFPDGRILRFETVAGSANDGVASIAYPDGRVARFPRSRLSNDARVRLRSDDVRFVLDQLAELNAGDPQNRFTGRLDLGRVGIAGHSFGGSTAAQVCALDSRCRAVLDLDGAIIGDAAGTTFAQPFMIMNSATEGLPGSRGLFFGQQLRGSAYLLAIDGTAHNSFSDLPLYPRASPIGTIAPARGHAVVTAYMLAFFDRHLKSLPTALLNGPSPAYPEMRIQSRQP